MFNEGIDVGGDKDKDDKPSWLSLLTGGLGTFAASLHALFGKIIVGFGTALKAVTLGLVKLGATLIAGLGSRLSRGFGRVRRGLRGLPKAMGKLPAFAKSLLSKAVGGIAKAGASVGGAVKGGLGAATGAVKGGLRAATGALRFETFNRTCSNRWYGVV